MIGNEHKLQHQCQTTFCLPRIIAIEILYEKNCIEKYQTLTYQSIEYSTPK